MTRLEVNTAIRMYTMFKFYIAGTEGSIVICVSPLTSILLEQQEKYSSKGIATEFVGEAQTN